MLRLSNMYHMIGRKNLEFVLTWDEFIQSPFTLFYGNLVGTSRWFTDYLGWVLVAVIFIGAIVAVIRRDIRIAILTVLVIIPWFASISMAKVLYPRYLLFFTPPLLIIIAYGLTSISDFVQKIFSRVSKNIRVGSLIGYISILLMLSYSLYGSYQILFNPPAAPLPLQDNQKPIIGLVFSLQYRTIKLISRVDLR